MIDLPMPPLEFRHLVGPMAPEDFDDPTTLRALDDLPATAFKYIFDFGCGCGRVARQLLRSGRAVGRYVGIDPHKEMVAWCQANISSRSPQFQFRHHNVYQEFMNPEGTADRLPLPIADGTVSLFLAWSVFTHLLQPDAEFYLDELARTLRPDGLAVTTWFQFDKRDFPMMQSFQNALYISDFDPTNAVIFDERWLQSAFDAARLEVSRRVAPTVRGHQWLIELRRTAALSSQPSALR